MKTTSLRPEDLRGVFAAPPLARRGDKRRAIDLEQNGKGPASMAAGGLRPLSSTEETRSCIT